MDTEEIKRELNKADSEILDIFRARPQCGIRISEKDYQEALRSILRNKYDPDKCNHK